jgi:hypothetical protein
VKGTRFPNAAFLAHEQHIHKLRRHPETASFRAHARGRTRGRALYRYSTDRGHSGGSRTEQSGRACLSPQQNRRRAPRIQWAYVSPTPGADNGPIQKGAVLAQRIAVMNSRDWAGIGRTRPSRHRLDRSLTILNDRARKRR